MKRYSGAKELLKDEVCKKVNKLNRDLLNFLDSVRDRQDVSMDKVCESLPPKYQSLVLLSTYMDENDFFVLRKMILDQTNDFKRDMDSELDKYTIRLNLIQGTDNERD